MIRDAKSSRRRRRTTRQSPRISCVASRQALASARRRARGWLRAQRARLSRKSSIGQALAYVTRHWDGLCVFLDNGRVEMDSNLVENLIRPLTLNR
ncbi:transposase [Aurantimonas sp. DM33-3]|nr:transposase [Aurantimonas sp. DM33-3]